MNKKLTALGLMSGTSGDGVDVAILTTDGEDYLQPHEACTYLYPKGLAHTLNQVLKNPSKYLINNLEQEITSFHIQVIENFFKQFKIKHLCNKIDLIGFHGQTICHDPKNHLSIQLGDGKKLANHFFIPTINQFRQNDILAGGEGAPFAPIFHKALAKDLTTPILILNIGGVCNITYLLDGEPPLACDTGPGVALINDWIQSQIGLPFDPEGFYALAGKVIPHVLEKFMMDHYWQIPPPKSLDRNHFSYLNDLVKPLSLKDGASTLTACTAFAVKAILPYLPVPPKRCYVSGGGRLNLAIMAYLRHYLKFPVEPIEKIGWNGDNLEAQLIAYLTVRSHYKLPLSFPTTTKVPYPMCGGIIHEVEHMGK